MKNVVKVLLVSSILAGAFAGSQIVYAADTDITNVITVDSQLDSVDDVVGDGQCDDGAGNCTLRAAIEEANFEPGTQTIEFNITGVASFTNSGEDGYTIAPQSSYPEIDDTVIINGYSQFGAQVNSTTAPEPLNTVLLIEIDGSGAGSASGFTFADGSNNSEVRGLVINNFADGNAVLISADNISVQGNFIGTNPTGLIAQPNTVGVDANNSDLTPGEDALIGGLDPSYRNLISGNTSGVTATAGYPGTGWTIQGNYVGVAADGETALPNSTVDGSGAFSIDDVSNVTVGGDQLGATNVISGNLSFGLAPLNAPNLTVQGNLIGTDWTGTTAIANSVGIGIGGDLTGGLIGGTAASARNIISGNTIAGISAGPTGRPTFAGNYVGLDVTGQSPVPNGAGILIASDTLVGGSVAGRNVVSGNTLFNISYQGTPSDTSGTEISGNYIGTDAQGNVDAAITAAQGEGVRISGNVSGALIGGTFPNLIAGNRGSGIAIRSLTITAFPLTITPSNVSILNNQIHSNTTSGPVVGAEGLGIDIYEATVANLTFPADMQADSYVNLGPTVNDVGDPDAGPNAYINFPVINSATQNVGDLELNIDLDAAGSTLNDEYRIEVYANDVADASGFGEGQTFLGFAEVANGDGQELTIVLPNGTDLTGKVISATATALTDDGDGFGATSEFSEISDVEIAVSPSQTIPGASGILAATGANSIGLLVSSAVLLLLVGFVLARRTRSLNI